MVITYNNHVFYHYQIPLLYYSPINVLSIVRGFTFPYEQYFIAKQEIWL